MLKEQMLLSIKDLFCRIKIFYFGTSDRHQTADTDTREAAEYIAAIKQKMTDLENTPSADSDDTVMLTECLSLIKQAFLAKNYRMAGDLSALGIRLCGVYTFPYLSRKKFFSLYVLPLRDKHEEAFFAEQETAFLSCGDPFPHLRPYFKTQAASALHYDEGDYDNEFYVAHPVLYSLFVALGILLFVGCIVGYGILINALGLFGAWSVLGYVGAALFGAGLCSLSFSFIRQYMGHVFTSLFLGGGALFVALSLLLL